MAKTITLPSFSFYRPGYGFTKSFFPQRKQGDTVFIKRDGKKWRGKITGANLDKDMNFLNWQVCVPSFSRYISIEDPNCPW